MATRTITFENLDGEQVTKTFEFRLRKGELAEFAMKHETNGIDVVSWLKHIAESNNASAILETVKELLALSIGERHGDSFVKNDDIRNGFFYTGAWDEMFMQFIEDPKGFGEFVTQMFPASLLAEVEKKQADPSEYSEKQLLGMDEAEFLSVVGSDPTKWDPRIMTIAYRRKTAAA